MPVKTDRLLHILGLVFAAYWGLKFAFKVAMMDDVEEVEQIFTRQDLDSGRVQQFVTSLSFKEALLQLQEKDSPLLQQMTNLLASSQHSAYFFETPSVTRSSVDTKHFQFVLVAAPQLAGVKADPDTFADYFDCDQKLVTSFMNLGGDAKLVAPCPLGSEQELDRYASLAPFMRSAPPHQVKAFWQQSAKVILDFIESKKPDKKLWVSTSGLGVFWLHLRLDSYPKYYTFHPYKHS